MFYINNNIYFVRNSNLSLIDVPHVTRGAVNLIFNLNTFNIENKN